MNQTARYIASVVLSLVVLGILYYGTFLPFKKSQLFIQVLGARGSFRSLTELEQTFDQALDYKGIGGVPSPIGQEELVRNTASYVLSFIQQNNDTQLIVPLADYAQKYYDPIIAYGRGMSFGQDMYLLGVMNEVMVVKTKDPKYLAAAHTYFSKALELGPKRPQALYGMFDIYRLEGNADAAKEIANQILSQWPKDDRTRQILNDLLKQN